MKTLHELFNRGGVFAPLVVVTIHVVVLGVMYFLGWLFDPVFLFIGRTVSHIRNLISDFFDDYDEH